MYLLPFLAQHGPGLTGAYALSMVCCPVGAPPTITPQKPYITPGPGATTADCGRARSRLPDSLPVPSTLPCSFISSSTLHFTTDLQTLFLQRPPLTPSIAWTSAPHCLNCPTRKFILASSSCFTVWTAAILCHPQPFSPLRLFITLTSSGLSSRRPNQPSHPGYSNSPRYSGPSPSLPTTLPALFDSPIPQRSKTGRPMVQSGRPRGLWR